jgi:hypothetical protein
MEELNKTNSPIPPDLNPGENTPANSQKPKAAAKTAVKSQKPKAAAKTAVKSQKPKAFKPLLGHDPKNRLVHLAKKGEKFEVSKPATGFKFTGAEKKAKEVYEHQLSCSHN